MAQVTNSLTKSKAEEKNNPIWKYEANGMEIKLTPEIVKSYLVSGDSTHVSDQELAMFINLCKYNKLNPWLKEAYCIKYGTSPATMVVGKEAYMKRAESYPEYDGMESGIIVQNDETRELNYRKGTLKLSDETIVGAWAEVWRKDRSHSTRIEISIDEYIGKKSDGKVNAQWSNKPATMIRKVALVQALREAFPETAGGMITAEEAGHSEEEADLKPMDTETGEIIDAEIKSQKPAQPHPAESESLI